MPGRAPSKPGRRRRSGGRLALLLGGALVFVAACSGGQGPKGAADDGGSSETSQPQAKITIAPHDQASGVSPTKTVTVAVAKGSVKKVTVRGEAGSDEEDAPDDITVKGEVAGDSGKWRSEGPLRPDTTYTVQALAVDGAGRTTSVTSSFTTLAPDEVLHASIAPLDGATVGVGMPIYVKFNNEVADKYKPKVERRLEVDMSEPVEGAWHWMSDDVLHFRPREYWPSGEQVTLHTNLTGVHAGEGLWGDQSRTIRFEVGDRHVTVAHVNQHTLTVKSGGDVVKTFPMSAGESEHPSSNGIYVAKLKQGHITMDSSSYGVPVDSPEGYSVETKWNVRYTNSGQFIHGAPWSVAQQGKVNVSHGCINLSLHRAKWFYNFTNRGDIIKVKGSSRGVQLGNGWTDWNVSWDEWVDGSALDRSVNSDA